MPRKRRPVSAGKALSLAAAIVIASVLPATLPAQSAAPVPGTGAPTKANLSNALAEQELKRFAGVYALVERYAAAAPNPDQAFYQGAIPGLLRRLDPHSVFFDPNQFQQLRQMETSTSKGFGTVVSILPGRVIVLQALPGTPSSRAGLSPGDEILAVNNIRIDRLEMEQIVQLLSQSRQKPAQLYVRRSGAAKVLSFTLVPEEMQSKSIERAFLLHPGIGYIRVSSWEAQTAEQMHDAIVQLGGNDLKGLVLDLRNNPGGIVTSALAACSFFLEPGQKILTIRGRMKAPEDADVPPEARPYPCKLAVIVNEKSASASEIVAGALQDHDRATIVGLPSYGKGLVESVFPLSEKTGMALTTALYYTPSGRSIQKPFEEADLALSPTAAHPNEQATFKTDHGRTVLGGGGITPDLIVAPTAQNRLRVALDASGSFVSFATQYTQQNHVGDQFEVTPQVLDQFQAFAADHNIQPSFAEWAAERDFIEHRLKVEIFNQALGVEKGDEIEVQFDPQVQAAAGAVR